MISDSKYCSIDSLADLSVQAPNHVGLRCIKGTICIARFNDEQVFVDPPRVTTLTLSARCCALPPAADRARRAAATDGTDGRTDGRTPDCYIDSAPLEAVSVNNTMFAA